MAFGSIQLYRITARFLSSRKALALAALAATAILQLLRRRRARPRNLRTFPGHWLLGVLPEVAKQANRKQQNQFFTSLHESLGQTYALWAPGGWNAVVTRDPKNVETILHKNFDNYPKGWVMRAVFDDLLGNGIFNADGHEWLHQRKTTSHMFTAKLFKEHIWVVVQRNAKKVRSMLKATEPEKSLDVFNLMNRFTLDTIGEIGFGKCIGSLEDPSSPFLKSFDRAQQITFERWYSGVFYVKKLVGLGVERKSNEHFARLDEYSRTLVRELQSSMAADDSKAKGITWKDIEACKSFVGLFMQDAMKKGEQLSEDYLRDLVLNFLIAGRDTTAQALSWTFYCLAMNPDAEAKARQEVYQTCGTEDPCYDDIKRMPYLQAVLSETLRLYPSVPLDVKLPSVDDTWPDGTWVAKNTVVIYNIYGMGRDPSIWGVDAEVFRPERWLEMKEPPSGYEYPVFNAGPRECLGKRLAMVEMKTCLAMLLPHVSFSLAVPPDEVTPDAQLTIGMAKGLPCFVQHLKQDENRPRVASNASTAAESDCTIASTAMHSDGTVDLIEGV